MYQFNDKGNLKPGAVNKEKYLKRLMMRRGIIISEDTIAQYPVRVIGSASSYIKIKEIVPEVIDSTAIDEFEF